MNVADLYVNLGLKGKSEVSKGLGDVSADLGSVQSMSLEAKAAILGAVYGFEQMMSKAMQLGTSLSSFSTITGINSKALQQYRYVMEGTGQSADELQNYFGSLQKQMTNMDFSKGVPEGFAALQKFHGQITTEERHDPLKMLQILQDFSQNKELTDAYKNHILDTFQMPDGVKMATRIGAFTAKALAAAPTVSDKTLNANRVAMGQWSHLWTKFENMLMNLNGKHGQQLVTGISGIADSMERLADSLLKIAERFKIFEWAQKALEGWKMIIDEINEGSKNAEPRIGDDIKGVTNQNWKTTLYKALFNSDAEKRAREGLKRLGEQDMMKYSLKSPVKNPAANHTTNNITTYATGVENADQLGDIIVKRDKRGVVNNSPAAGVAN